MGREFWVLVGLAGVVACGAATVTDTGDDAWWSLADGVLTLTNADATGGVTNVYETVIGASVKKIVKTGAGRVRLAGVNTAFEGAIDIQDGILAGNILAQDAANDTTYRNFGTPSEITIASGAFEITDPNTTAVSGPVFSCPVRVQGAGPDGAGAIRRSYSRVNGGNGTSIHRVFADVTLTGPATFGCGGRWGIGTKLDMGGHKLTIVNADATAKNPIWEFGRDTTLTIANPGDIDVEGGEFLIERVTFKPDNALAAMRLTMRGGLVRTYNLTSAVPLPVTVSGGASVKFDGGNAQSSLAVLLARNLWTGPITLDGTLTLTSYSDSFLCGLNINAPVNGAGTLATGGSKSGTYYLGGSGTSEFNAFQVARGHLVLRNAGCVCVTNAYPSDQWGNPTAMPNRIGGELTGVNVPRLAVDAGTVFVSPYRKTDGRYLCRMGVGYEKGTSGIFEIRPGGLVTNDLIVGTYGKGAVYQSGGTFVWRAGQSNDGFLGANTYGYYGMTDGVLETEGWINYGREGRGLFLQRGGTVRVTKDQPIKLARNGANSYAQHCILGGAFDSAGEIRFGDNGATGSSGYEAVFAVKGANATAKAKLIAQYAGATEAQKGVGVVSVADGGTLTVNRIYKRESSTGLTTAAAWAKVKDTCTNTVLYLTFDGGTLKTGQSGEFFYDADGSRMPNRVLVYEKGATIDTDGKDVTWRAPLARPEGKGLAAVTIDNATLTAADYAVGPGAVKVLNGGWYANGGTVAADFDDATRTQKPTAIVTCPGERYTEEDCTVQIENRDFGKVMIARTLRDLGSGGLTKRGAGVLTLASANTYGGATRLEGGTLAFTHEQGYPGGDLEIAAAAVQGQTLASPLLTAHTLAFAVGKGVRVTEADTLNDKTFGGLKTVATFTTPLAALPALTLVDSDGSAWAANRQWRLQLADGGRTLRFGAFRGTQVLIR